MFGVVIRFYKEACVFRQNPKCMLRYSVSRKHDLCLSQYPGCIRRHRQPSARCNTSFSILDAW